jgi:hypothetical protein
LVSGPARIMSVLPVAPRLMCTLSVALRSVPAITVPALSVPPYRFMPVASHAPA